MPIMARRILRIPTWSSSSPHRFNQKPIAAFGHDALADLGQKMTVGVGNALTQTDARLPAKRGQAA